MSTFAVTMWTGALLSLENKERKKKTKKRGKVLDEIVVAFHREKGEKRLLFYKSKRL